MAYYKRRVAAGLGSAAFLLGLITRPAHGAESPAHCNDVAFPVSVAPDQPADYTVWGQLCTPIDRPARTVQILLHGLNYSHLYWDFPRHPDRYSYVRWMNRAGYATLNIDRIGVGRSSHPPSDQVTMASNAFTIHQIVTKLKAQRSEKNATRLPSFQKVFLVGHSYGSEIAKLEASLNNDVDALVLTGNAHKISLSAIMIASGLGQPVQEVPRLAAEVPPGDPGYLTVQDAWHTELMYNLDNADPEVISIDQANKETNTIGELNSIGDANAPGVTAHLRIPILIVDGAEDKLSCAPDATDCSSPVSLAAAEQPFYPETRIAAAVIPAAGHSVNLHLNARTAYRIITMWASRIPRT